MESGLSKDVERPEEELILVLFSIVSMSGIFLCVAPLIVMYWSFVLLLLNLYYLAACDIPDFTIMSGHFETLVELLNVVPCVSLLT